MLTLIIGGARSGKSRLAQKLASTAARVTYIATAQPGDDSEMAARIELHRVSRPACWRTIEEPVALAEAVERADADTVLVDCLTIWLSNLFFRQIQDDAGTQIQRVAAAALHRDIILVSNELGSGTVPEHALPRAFRDAQGLLNQQAAEAADQVILTVAGLPLYLKTRQDAR
jgi:adenosylcobinamide kinase/adenosylcobinamide-phosphate guanylyltransferase